MKNEWNYEFILEHKKSVLCTEGFELKAHFG